MSGEPPRPGNRRGTVQDHQPPPARHGNPGSAGYAAVLGRGIASSPLYPAGSHRTDHRSPLVGGGDDSVRASADASGVMSSQELGQRLSQLEARLSGGLAPTEVDDDMRSMAIHQSLLLEERTLELEHRDRLLTRAKNSIEQLRQQLEGYKDLAVGEHVLRKELTQASEEQEAFKTRLQEQQEAMKDQAREFRQKEQKLWRELDTRQTVIEQLDAIRRSLEARLAQEAEQSAHFRNDLEARLAEEARRGEALRAMYEGVRREAEGAAESANRQAALVAAHAKRNEEGAARVRFLEGELKECRAALQGRSQELDRVRGELDGKQEAMASLQQRHNALEAGRDRLEAQGEQQQEAARAATSESARLAQLLQEAEAEGRALRVVVADRDQELADLKTEVVSSRALVQRTTQSLDKARAQVAQLTRDKDELEVALARSAHQAQEAHATIARLEDLRSSLQSELTATQQRAERRAQEDQQRCEASQDKLRAEAREREASQEALRLSQQALLNVQRGLSQALEERNLWHHAAFSSLHKIESACRQHLDNTDAPPDLPPNPNLNFNFDSNNTPSLGLQPTTPAPVITDHASTDAKARRPSSVDPFRTNPQAPLRKQSQEPSYPGGQGAGIATPPHSSARRARASTAASNGWGNPAHKPKQADLARYFGGRRDLPAPPADPGRSTGCDTGSLQDGERSSIESGGYAASLNGRQAVSELGGADAASPPLESPGGLAGTSAQLEDRLRRVLGLIAGAAELRHALRKEVGAMWEAAASQKEALEARMAADEGRLAGAEKAVAGLQVKLLGLRDAVSQREGRVASLEGMLQGTLEENLKLKGGLNSAESQAAALRLRVQQLSEAWGPLTGRSTSTSDLARVTMELQEARSRLHALEAEKDALRNRHGELAARLEDLQQERDSLASMHEQLHSERGRLEGDVTDLQAQLRSKEAECLRNSQDLSDLHRERRLASERQRDMDQLLFREVENTRDLMLETAPRGRIGSGAHTSGIMNGAGS